MKKLFCAIMAAVLIWMMVGSVSAEQAFSGNPSKTGNIEFTDVKQHWALASIKKMAFKGIAFGYEDSTFHPNSPITRLDTAVMLYRLFEYLDPKEDNDVREVPFVDTDALTPQQQSYISFVSELGIMVGDARTNTFRPSSAINRAEASVIIVRALGLEHRAKTMNKVTLNFKDAETIPEWARPYIALAVETGLIKGYTDKTFKPDRSITRAEMTVLIDRLDKILKTPEDNREYFGSILAIGSRMLNIRLDNGSMKNFRISDDVELFNESSRILIGQLKPEDEIEFIANNSDEIVFAATDRERPRLTLQWIYGILQDIDEDRGVLKVYPHGSPSSIEVFFDEGTYFDSEDRDIVLELTEGAEVVVIGEVSNDAINALEVKVKIKGL